METGGSVAGVSATGGSVEGVTATGGRVEGGLPQEPMWKEGLVLIECSNFTIKFQNIIPTLYVYISYSL